MADDRNDSERLTCWASSLGDCEGKMSREHLVSKCFWGDADEPIAVHGFNWCAEDYKHVSVANLVGKVLCRHHNSLLGEHVDAVAADFVTAIKESMRLREVRNGIRATWYVRKSFWIDGETLERWFLKTFINLNCRSKMPLTAPTPRGEAEHKKLVEVAFGKTKFTEPQGLYLALDPPGRMRRMDRRLQHKAFHDHLQFVGGLFSFCGYDFYLNLREDFTNMDHLGLRQISLHPREFLFCIADRKNREVPSHSIVVEWPDQAGVRIVHKGFTPKAGSGMIMHPSFGGFRG